jgi:hypothetical protein
MKQRAATPGRKKELLVSQGLDVVLLGYWRLRALLPLQPIQSPALIFLLLTLWPPTPPRIGHGCHLSIVNID